ncbi:MULTISPECIES: SRPBCC family protein [Salinibaculum]|uniref:SRPBCC family protein n=1 Tax=Salinibaculum TaxID=2732368 RepID=UPI0030D0D1F8
MCADGTDPSHTYIRSQCSIGVHTVSVRREIDAPREVVWGVLDDFGGVAKYNPNVTTSSIVAGPESGPGATRECVLRDGGRIEEEITEYVPDTGYTVNFTDVGKFPLRENVVDIHVESVDGTRTAVTMTSHFRPKFGPLGWLLAKTMMESKFRDTFDEVLEGLDSYVHTLETPAQSG